MANDARPPRRNKDDENNNLKGRQTSGKGSTSTNPSPSRKSERLEKRNSTTPATRMPIRVEKQTVPIPLRRSERSKKPSSSNSSDSKKSDKSLSPPDIKRKKEKKEKSVKQLTMETKKVEISNKIEKQVKRRMSGRAYLELFKDKDVKATGHNEDRSNASVSGSTKETLERNVESLKHGSKIETNGPEVQDTSDGGEMAREISDNSEQPQLIVKEKLQSPEFKNSTMKGRIPNDDIGVEKDHDSMSLKRKRTDLNMNCDASAMIANKDIGIACNDITSSPSRCENEICDKTCGSCFKRQRVDNDLTEQEFCSCHQNLPENLDKEDRGELEAVVTTEIAAKSMNHVQQKEPFVNFPANGGTNICFVCKLGGHLLCCDGKGCERSCHLSCLKPPLEDVPLGAWHCSQCTRKKIESGVHSLSGVESIWDSREVEVSDDSGCRRQRQYFVKYKGCAHVHNRWVPELQLLCEVPTLVAKFNRKNQTVRWKQKWTVPHRLLQRRSLVSPEQHNESIDNLDCNYEWLVKWCGLGYEHATWELENAPFINSPEGRSLIRDYEDRYKRAKRTSCSISFVSIEKTNKREKVFPDKLSQLSAGGASGFDNKLDFVSKLREYWLKGQNAVVFDDQERIARVISFIYSLLSDCCQPFLIISTSAVLHLWDEEFLRLAPFAHVVLYCGNREVRKSIRTLEFSAGGGCVMFQVLITSPEVLVEDINVFESIRWEAIVVDECQRSKIFSHFEQIKVLGTDMRLLLVSGQLKDSIAHLKILSLLNSPSSDDDLTIDSNDTIGSLKEKLLKYIAYEGKLDTSRFVEYWVPVQISDMQLEQYCDKLLQNSFSLCSHLKSDPVGILREILNILRKCCDSPYLVDESLQGLLIKGKETEIVDVGVKASGKLQLLDTMLLEMKNRGLRVVVLFQPTQAISGKMGLGDILDDIIRMRFGPDSYERIDGNVRSKDKQVALNKFNNESGRFVFLLETRACLPSIILSSVDTVIIFNSDCSPVNDIKALQKITLDPQFEKIKIFRLYSSCTVEEKVLILAKQDKTPDGYLQNSRPSTSHLLLMWGASHLFNRLDEFHGGNTPASSASNLFDRSFWKDVVQEFITILTQTGEDTDTSKFNIILEVKQNLGIYSTDFPLFGESEIEVMDEGLAHIYWKNLLEGKHPCWKYSSGSTPRSRKRVQHFDGLQNKLDAENDEVVKKHRKVTSNSVHPSSSKPGVETKIPSRDKKGSSGIPAHRETTYLNHDSTSPRLVNNILEVPKESSDSQESFYLLLKPEMAELCEVLKLEDDAKGMVEKFLEYVMSNHPVNRERRTIVQAFQISLCWTVASLMKQKIDHKESLALAKKYLNFGCNKDEADLVYSKLRCLKDVFLHHIKKLEVKNCSKASELFFKDVSKDNLQARPLQSKTSDLQRVNVEEERSTGKECCCNLDHFKLAQKDIIKSIKKIKKKCSKQMAKAHQKHQGKKEGIDQKYEEEKAQLENKKRTEVAIIRLQSQGNTSMLTDRLKNLDNEYAKQFEELQRERDIQLKNLEAVIGVEVKKVRDKEACWLEEINSWLHGEVSHKPPFNKSRDGMQCLQTSEQVDALDSHESVVPASHHSESLSPNIMLMRGAGGVESPMVNETLNDDPEACGNLTETITHPISRRSVSDELDTVASAETSVSRLERDIRVGNLGDGQETAVSMDLGSVEQIPGRTMLSMGDGQIQAKVNELVTSNDGPEHDPSPVFSSEEWIYDGVRLSPEGEIPRGVTQTVSLSEGPENVDPVNVPSLEKQVPDRVESVHDAVLVEVFETGSSSDGPESIIAVNFPASGELVPDKTVLTVPENVSSGDNLENDSVNLFSSRDQIPDAEASLGNLQNGCSEPTTLTVPDEEVMLQVPENVSAGDSLENESFNLSSCREQIQDSTTGVPDVEALLGNLQDGCSEPVRLTGTRDGDAAASGLQSDARHSSHSFDAVASDQSLHGSQAAEPLAQPQLLTSIDSPSGLNPTRLPSVHEVEHQPSSGHYIANQITQAPTMMVENHVELSDLALLSAASLVTNSPIDIPIDGLRTTISDPRMASVTPGYSNHTVQNVHTGVAHTGASQFSVPSYRDPLQRELDRLCKETEETIKTHEETKLRLKSECDQEIENIVTQIRRKYEIKLQETEAEFLSKKRELDANQNKVHMNKILADAFRSKCADPKQSNAALQQEIISNLIQQRARLPSQHFAQRSSALAGSSSCIPPSATQQTTVAPTVSLQTSLPAVSPHTGVHPVQAVLHSAALFSSTPLTRPSHSSSLTSPAGNLHVGSGLSAPPHLRPFRPSGVVPSQLTPNNPPATSPLLPRLPTQTPILAYQPHTHNRAQPGNPSGGVSSPISSLSALELLVDVSNRSGPNPILPNSLPPQSNLHSSLGPSVQPESGQRSSTPPNPVQNSVASDVVCLSDDE